MQRCYFNPQLKSCECLQKALHNDLNASGKASALAAFFTHVSIVKLKQIHEMTHPTLHRERQRDEEPEVTEEELMAALDNESEEERD